MLRKPKQTKDPHDFASAERSAENILAYADNTEAKLYEKLRERAYSEEVCAGVVAKMKKQGFVNDRRYMENLAISLAKRYGLRVIKDKLYQKGFSRADIEEWLPEILEEVDFRASAAEAYKKALKGDDAAADKRAVASLVRLGYSWDEIAYARKIRSEESGIRN